MKIEITLKQHARSAAIEARRIRGIPTSWDWLGPSFDNAEYCPPSRHGIPGFACVRVHDEAATEYYYPLADIARIKLV